MPVLRDIRLAVRLLRRSPSSTAIAVLSIALSVGATAVVFTAIKSVLIDSLPYSGADELVKIGTDFPNIAELSRSGVVFWDDMREVRRSTRTLSSIGVYGSSLLTLPGDAHTLPEAIYGGRRGRHHPQPWLMGAPLPVGSRHPRTHAQSRWTGLHDHRRHAACI